MQAAAAFPVLFVVLVAVLGALVGSFLNVVILRLPRRMEYEWKMEAAQVLEQAPPAGAAPPGIVRTPSHCGACGAQIRPWHNIPVLGWLLLRGRCADCGKGISVQYPAVELLTALLSATVAWHYGPTVQCAAALAFTWLLVGMSGIDVRERLLPDAMTLPLLWLGLLLALFPVFVDLRTAVIGAMAGYVSLWLVFHLFRLITGKEGMGYGDFKLFAALGAWLGWQQLPLVILLSSMVGAVVGLVMMGMRRMNSERMLPFGPFLAAAGWIAMLWGPALLHSYLQLFRL